MGKTVYELKICHHCPTYIKGDLEDETIQIGSKVFSTRTAANTYLEEVDRRKDPKYSSHKSIVKRGNKASYLWIYTGKTWIHENTGETMEEYFSYIVSKVLL